MRSETPRVTGHEQRESSATALNGQGYRLLQRGRYRDAEPLLREAIAKRPSNPTYGYALYNLGWSLVAQGRASEAIEPLRRSAAQQPGRWEPQHRLAEAYEKLGQLEKAVQASEKARALRGGRHTRSASGRRASAAPVTAPVVERVAAPPVESAVGSAYRATYNAREERLLQRTAVRTTTR